MKMKRIKTGWELTKKSWSVLRSHPGLVRLPITSVILSLLAFIIFGIPGAVLASGSSNVEVASGIVLIIIASYLSSYFVIYYNVALAAATNIIFSNTSDSDYVKSGLAVAKERRGIIAKWAVVALIVSMIFNLLRERGGIVGQIAAGLGAAIWGLVTFLIAPVLAMEGLGPFDAIKRSTSMFKEKWGEQVTGNIAIGAITMLLVMLSILLVVGGVFLIISGSAGVALGIILIILAVISIMATIVVSAAARGIFGVALYRYIVSDEVNGPFTANELEGSIKQKTV